MTLPAPYYEDEWCTIYHADCRDLLDHLTFDVIVTDPPYGTGLYDTDVVVEASLAAMIRAFPAIVFGWPEYLIRLCVDQAVVPDEWVTWWPTNAAMRGFNPRGLMREVETIAAFGTFDWKRLRSTDRSTSVRLDTYRNGKRLRGVPDDPESRNMGDCWRDPSPGLGFNSADRNHPNEKPTQVLSRLCQVTDGVILDPFMGSGTTLRAAKDLGRRSIGIEVEESHCEVAVSRLAQDVLPFAEVSG